MRLINLEGKSFGRWKVVSRDPNSGKAIKWFVECQCGAGSSVSGAALRRGTTLSCGCFNREVCGRPNITHGKYKTREYRIWSGMLCRCQNPNNLEFPGYGGRGIIVCDRWTSFENFFADMGPRPTLAHSLDRKDVNGNYEPSNCRWATIQEQANNKRSTRRVFYRGIWMSLTEAARLAGVVKPRTAIARLIKGWPIANAVEIPANATRSGERAS